MNIVIGGSIGGATLTYEIIAVLGYLTFGSKVGVFSSFNLEFEAIILMRVDWG